MKKSASNVVSTVLSKMQHEFLEHNPKSINLLKEIVRESVSEQDIEEYFFSLSLFEGEKYKQYGIMDVVFGEGSLKNEAEYLKAQAKKCCISSICLEHGIAFGKNFWVMWDESNAEKKYFFPSKYMTCPLIGGTAFSEFCCAEIYLFDHLLFEFVNRISKYVEAKMIIKHRYISWLYNNISDFASNAHDLKQRTFLVFDPDKWLCVLQEQYPEYCGDIPVVYSEYTEIYCAVGKKIFECQQAIYDIRKEMEAVGLWSEAKSTISDLQILACRLFDTTPQK